MPHLNPNPPPWVVFHFSCVGPVTDADDATGDKQ